MVIFCRNDGARRLVSPTTPMSQSLRLHEIRSAIRLIGECRELGYDAGLWQPHLLDGLQRFTVQAAGAQPTWIAVFRRRGQRRYGARAGDLMGLVNKELGSLVGTALTSPREPSPSQLAPRLRDVLACLLRGEASGGSARSQPSYGAWLCRARTPPLRGLQPR
jgi:hypothetical protein